MLRVLGRVRLSRDTDASTSVARQRQHIQEWADRNAAVVVGWAEDVDVSGKVDPFKTPDLGPWLRPPKMNDWDVMVAWKLDRVSRAGARTVNRLIDWMEESGKYLVTTQDNIDTRNTNVTTEIVLAVYSSVAKEEREAISTRQIDSQRKLRMDGRFRGGPIPYGYKKVKRGSAWYLEVHSEHADHFREMVSLYLDKGMSLGGIAAVMNDRGVPTPQKRRAGDGKWRSGTIIQMFKSRTMLGQTVYKGAVVRDGDGKIIQRAPELISQERWDRLQERLASARKQPVGSWSGKKKLLLDIIFCAICGKKMYFTGSGPRNYWRCSGATHAVPGEAKCTGGHIPANRIEPMALDYVKAVVGDKPVTEEKFFPAEGSGAELKDTQETIKGLRWEWDNNMVDKSDPDEVREWQERMAKFTQQLKDYKAMPNKPARYEMVATGGTWGEAIESSQTPEEKRAVLLKLGMTIDARIDDGEITATIITNLDRLRKTVPGALEGPVYIPFVEGEDGGAVVLVDGVYVPEVTPGLTNS